MTILFEKTAMVRASSARLTPEAMVERAKTMITDELFRALFEQLRIEFSVEKELGEAEVYKVTGYLNVTY